MSTMEDVALHAVGDDQDRWQDAARRAVEIAEQIALPWPGGGLSTGRLQAMMLLVYAEAARTGAEAARVGPDTLRAWLAACPREQRTGRLEAQLRAAGHDVPPADRPAVNADPARFSAPASPDPVAALWQHLTDWTDPGLYGLSLDQADGGDWSTGPDLGYKLAEVETFLQRDAAPR